MTVKKNPLQRIRLVYRRSSPLLKCALLAAIVLCTVCLIVLRTQLLTEKQKQEQLRTEAAVLEQKNAELEKLISELGTVQSVKRIALTELDLVMPDTVLYLPQETQPE